METQQPIVHWCKRGAVLHPFHPCKPRTSEVSAVTCPDCLDLLKETT